VNADTSAATEKGFELRVANPVWAVSGKSPRMLLEHDLAYEQLVACPGLSIFDGHDDELSVSQAGHFSCATPIGHTPQARRGRCVSHRHCATLLAAILPFEMATWCRRSSPLPGSGFRGSADAAPLGAPNCRPRSGQISPLAAVLRHRRSEGRRGAAGRVGPTGQRAPPSPYIGSTSNELDVSSIADS
jgi:hypothetical protein